MFNPPEGPHGRDIILTCDDRGSSDGGIKGYCGAEKYIPVKRAI
jgi:hypothetical protein